MYLAPGKRYLVETNWPPGCPKRKSLAQKLSTKFCLDSSPREERQRGEGEKKKKIDCWSQKQSPRLKTQPREPRGHFLGFPLQMQAKCRGILPCIWAAFETQRYSVKCRVKRRGHQTQRLGFSVPLSLGKCRVKWNSEGLKNPSKEGIFCIFWHGLLILNVNLEDIEAVMS